MYENLDNGTKQIYIRETNLVPELKDSIKLPENYTQFSWIDITNGKETYNFLFIFIYRTFSHMDENISVSEI